MHIQRSVGAVVVALALFTVCAFSQITVSPASGSGVTNTGNAAVGDVASGKTFSSSVLTNATGTSTKNATVPNDAPIQPPQAFVDNITSVFFVSNSLNVDGVALSNKGITGLDGYLIGAWFYLADLAGGTETVNLSGNALPVADVNELLSVLVDIGVPNGNLNISGGTNAAPTGQGITDKNTLITNGWTVTTN